MDTRISLLDEIKKGGYQASLITTFNAYLPFYEEVILRKLMSNGVRHNVVMMDQRQCQQSFATQPPSFAGRRYSLLPMFSAGAFHPKIVLLLGKRKGFLAVGSHNLTLSGFGNNRELTNIIRYLSEENEGAASVIAQVLQYVETWMGAQGERLPTHLHKMVRKLSAFAPWLSAMKGVPENISVIATRPEGPSLWHQLVAKVEGSVNRVIIGGAFFDSKLAFLNQLRVDFDPGEIIVGVDPSTVKAPSELADIDFIRVVNASQLKPSGVDGEVSGQYLHAKSLVIETSVRRYLVTGSANPSAPAWLASASAGNTEMMIIRSDAQVDEVAETLGLLSVADGEAIKTEEWEAIANNWRKEEPLGESLIPIGIAVSVGGEIRFSMQDNIAAPLRCELLDDEGLTLASISPKIRESNFILKPDSRLLPSVVTINVRSEGEIKAQLFVHHEDQINEQSRTGPQRAFRDALSSLSFSSPDLETFLACVDRIIFAKAVEVNKQTKLATGYTQHLEKHKEGDDAGFAVDLSDTQKVKKKHRLQTKDDLAYLLDVLLYHLKLDGADHSAYDAADHMGRSEEEQAGQEDSEDDQKKNAELPEDARKKILALCHKKVKSLVSRMSDNLAAFRKKKCNVEDVIVKLTGVLAVMRELRNCDDSQSWVERGQTTVPLDCRKALMSSVLENLFEGDQSFWQIDQIRPELASNQDVASLKGLIAWLAWDCGLRLRLDAPFAERPEEENKRLLESAWLLAVAQLINSDDVAKFAKQSIGPLCKGELVWLNWIVELNIQLIAMRRDYDNLLCASDVSSGDIAIHAAVPHLRLVRGSPERGRVSMVRLETERPLITYMADKVKIISSKELLPLVVD